jgi:hypothetical protein
VSRIPYALTVLGSPEERNVGHRLL